MISGQREIFHFKKDQHFYNLNIGNLPPIDGSNTGKEQKDSDLMTVFHECAITYEYLFTFQKENA